MFTHKVTFSAVVVLFIGLLSMPAVVQAQVQEESQETIITGKVLDAETEQSVSGVKVRIKGTEKSATTNKKGMFSIAGLQTGTHTVVVNSDDYKKYSKEVDVNESGKNLKVKLKPADTSTR